MSDGLWHCDPDRVHCAKGHPLLFRRAEYAVRQRHVDGHTFMGCQQCTPTSFFFGVITSRPDPLVTCYAITRDQFDYWTNEAADVDLEGGTLEMLHLLGYTAYWPGPKTELPPRRTR